MNYSLKKKLMQEKALFALAQINKLEHLKGAIKQVQNK
jgi:hypothetical protein